MITDIRLQSFRSFVDASFDFDPGVNIIVGPNASGKTNLLEAILVIAIGKSYRARDDELVYHDAPWARLGADMAQGHRSVKFVPSGDGGFQKQHIINDVTYKRLQLPRTIPTVLFEPNHLLLFAGSPELRREYLDGLLDQTVSGYASLRRQYKRTLAQRNALLKQEYLQKDQLFAWNIRLSQLGGQIAQARLRLVTELSKDISDLYNELSHTKSIVGVVYASGCDVEQYSSDLLHKLDRSIETDIQRGFTGFGPHRDDLQISLNGHPAQDTASRGETRTLMLALKVLEMRLLEKERGQKPILLLDDVFSELDGARRRALTMYLSTHQTFLTTTDADVVSQDFTQGVRTIPLVWRG